MSEQLVQVLIGGVDYSNRILDQSGTYRGKVVLHSKATEGIGSFSIDLWNQDFALSAFPPETSVIINLAQNPGGTLYPKFSGYVDTCKFITTQDANCKIIAVMQVKGRDCGQDSANKTVWGSDDGHIENIVYNLLIYGASGILAGNTTSLSTNSPSNPYTEIGYTVPSPLLSTETISWQSNGRDFICNSITALLKESNWDGYTDYNKQWHMFPVGTQPSNIQLYDNSPTLGQNNVIGPVDYTPCDSVELRNILIGYGSTVQDSWTDWGCAEFYWITNGGGNANAAYFCNSNCAVTIRDAVDTNGQDGTIAYVATPSGISTLGGVDPYQEPQAGASFIQILTNNGTLNPTVWGMNFPTLFHWWLPLNYTALQQIQFSLFMHNPYQMPENQGDVTRTNAMVPFTFLVDNLGNSIVYYFDGQYRFNGWLTFSVDVGYNISTEAQLYAGNGTWDGIDYPQPPGVNGVQLFGNNNNKWIYRTWTNQGSTFPSTSSLNQATGNYFIYTGSSQTQGLYLWNGSAWVLEDDTVTTNLGFTWKVVSMGFGLLYNTLCDYVLFDNLIIPQVQITAVADHSGLNGPCEICGLTYPATPYKARHLPVTDTSKVYQTDLSSYIETVAQQRCGFIPLDSGSALPSSPTVGQLFYLIGTGVMAYYSGEWTPQSNATVAQTSSGYFMQNVLQTATLRCDGSAGLVDEAWMWYPGLSISLNGALAWRIIEITETIGRNIDRTGFNHVVDLSLVPQFMQIDMEQWTYSQHGDIGISRQLHDRVSALENSFQLFTPTASGGAT